MGGRLKRLFEEEAVASLKLEKASHDRGCAGSRNDKVVKCRRGVFVKACKAWELAKGRIEADPEAMQVLSETSKVFGVQDGFLHLDEVPFRAAVISRINEMEGGEK